MVVAGFDVDAVTWRIDHAARAITVHVNIAFYPVNSRAVTPPLVARVLRQIHDYWDGLYYKCYRFVVEVNPLVVDDPSDAPDDFADVGLDGGPVRIRSQVCTRKLFDRPMSDSGSRLPIRGTSWFPSRSTIWSSWTNDGVWAHEFGHLIGISDGYTDVPGSPKRPCHTPDLMVDATSPVSAQMVSQAVHRSGLDVSGITCPLEFRTNTTSLNLFLAELRDVTVEARCEDYPAWSDDSTRQGAAEFTGHLRFTAGYLAGDDWSSARGVLDVFGVPADPNLTTERPVDDAIAFSLPQPGCEQKDAGTEQSFTIMAPGATVTGYYTRDAKSPVPRMTRPLLINDVSTDTFLPGPPLEGYFLDASDTGGSSGTF